jgi:hypothetical protein
MRSTPNLARAVAAGAVFAFAAGMAAAQGGPGGDNVTADIAMRELQTLGHPAELTTDSGGAPRLITTIDGFKIGIFFYGCAQTGELRYRRCQSMQFSSIYTLPNPISSLSINKWNSEKRFARGSTYTDDDGKPVARVAVDAWFDSTGGNAARMFRSYLNIMKIQNAEFRKFVTGKTE